VVLGEARLSDRDSEQFWLLGVTSLDRQHAARRRTCIPLSVSVLHSARERRTGDGI
jgi:hypothetical protein